MTPLATLVTASGNPAYLWLVIWNKLQLGTKLSFIQDVVVPSVYVVALSDQNQFSKKLISTKHTYCA